MVGFYKKAWRNGYIFGLAIGVLFGTMFGALLMIIAICKGVI